MDKVTPFTDAEKRCIALDCPNFVCWSYWMDELHSCKLQGESSTIEHPAEKDCPLLHPEE